MSKHQNRKRKIEKIKSSRARKAADRKLERLNKAFGRLALKRDAG